MMIYKLQTNETMYGRYDWIKGIKSILVGMKAMSRRYFDTFFILLELFNKSNTHNSNGAKNWGRNISFLLRDLVT